MLNDYEINELNEHGLYTTGQFAKMFDIEKSTLHYYDKIGLISPQIKGDNNYRYYSWQQFDDITLILTLREWICQYWRSKNTLKIERQRNLPSY